MQNEFKSTGCVGPKQRKNLMREEFLKLIENFFERKKKFVQTMPFLKHSNIANFKDANTTFKPKTNNYPKYTHTQID